MQATFSDRLAKPIGPFSPAVRSSSQGCIYVSGQSGRTAETGKLVGSGSERQTEQVFANLAALTEGSGRSFADVVRATVYLTSMGDFAAMNAVCAKRFKAPYPARMTIAVPALPLGANVEIDVVVATAESR
jgi:2-iminobutanoate/2-iminopropanoate deaminase